MMAFTIFLASQQEEIMTKIDISMLLHGVSYDGSM